MTLLISEFEVQRLIVLYPILNLDNTEILLGVAYDNSLDTGVDDGSLAHSAGVRVLYVAPVEIYADEIESGAEHIVSRCMYDSVCFSVNGTAELISFASGYIELVSGAIAEVAAVLSASGSACVACGNDLVIFYDDSTVVTS